MSKPGRKRPDEKSRGQAAGVPFEGLTITLEDNGDTLLTGPVVDDAALHGLLKSARFRNALALGQSRSARPGRRG
jgi:hypothetical protein